ncbi:hypothetical protein BaRGS_00034150 [Batillaria attramentaria]|uniref:Sulfotransferase n=1 Tax=Batillaria attramentaria TaxID=370345 RepID=A0ABD0JIF8_9CAEN
MYSRQTQRRLLLLLLLPAAWLIYASFTGTGGSDTRKGGKIILMTYGRSGSSFTSDIIQRHPDVFYTFEPLHNLLRRHIGMMEDKNNFWYSNQTRDRYDRESVSIMEVFLSCSYETMRSNDINNYQLRNSKDSRLLWGCAQLKRNFTALAILDCFLYARRICASRPVNLVKTIRFRGSAAAEMMARHDELKILYLIRDPRGTINSQRRVFRNFDRNQIQNFSKEYCQRFREDLVNLEPLFDKYPDRMKLLRYETLAENPMKVSEEMYKFLGLEFTADVRDFVFNITSAGQRSKNAYGTSKPNSTEAAYAWRRGVTLFEAQTIDATCSDIYLKLGYLPVHSEQELRSWNYSLKRSVVFHGTVI